MFHSRHHQNMSYASIDIEYLEQTEFNNERIFDFLDTTTPLCSVHQTRTVLTFFYLISISVIYLMWHQLFKVTCPLQTITIFFPLIFTAIIHVIMTLLYVVFAIFDGTSIKTCLGFIFSYHTVYPFVIGIGFIALLMEGTNGTLFFASLFTCISVVIDFIIGFYSMRSHRFHLIFEAVAMFPCSILTILYSKGFVPLFVVYVPFLLYFVIYIVTLSLLMNCCKPCKRSVYSFLSDPEIAAEITASNDYESFWNSSYWREKQQTRRRSDSSDDSSSSSSVDGNYMRQTLDASILIDPKKRDLKFPKKEKFQLYKLDTDLEQPFFITSLSVTTIFTAFVAICLFDAIQPFSSFYYFVGLGIALIFCVSLFKSRAFGYNTFVITNVSNDIVDILWDHPSFTYVF